MAGVRVHQPWQQDSRIISGASLNCSAIRGLLPLGSNPSGGDDLANILGLIRQCPNGQEAGLVRSLELVHRLVRLYPGKVPCENSLFYTTIVGLFSKRLEISRDLDYNSQRNFLSI